jgi:hypothetical protein
MKDLYTPRTSLVAKVFAFWGFIFAVVMLCVLIFIVAQLMKGT